MPGNFAPGSHPRHATHHAGVVIMTTTQTPSLQDMLTIMAQQQQMLQTLIANAVAPTQTEVLDAVAETATTVPAAPAGTYFVGTVSKVAMHNHGLQMQETGDRYWNVAKASRATVNYE